MAQGLQVFDENGKLVLDINDRITKYLGVFSLTATAKKYSKGSVTQTIAIDDNMKPWLNVINTEYSNSYGQQMSYRYKKVSGGMEVTVTLDNDNGVATSATVNFMYGVY